MPLPASINSVKDSEQAYQPLLLVTITALSGAVLRLASEGLNTNEGAFPYNGNSFQGRIVDYQLNATQGHEPGGVDVMSRATIRVADPDKVLYLAFERAHGIKRAKITIDFIFREAGTSNYSTDFARPFEGECDQPESDARYLTITATSSLHLGRARLPVAPMQRRCPLVNPITTQERALAADPESIFFRCGETRDTGTAPPCQYNAATCTQPLRRAGMERESATSGRGRNYVTGKWLDFNINPNARRWGQPIPLVFGTAWVDGLTSIEADGNATRGEAVLAFGEIDEVLEVVVNDIILQRANDITGAVNYQVADPLARFNVINRGYRDGAPNQDNPWNGQGDSYGNIAAILWVLHNKYADPAAEPRVRALIRGCREIRVYSDPNTYTAEYTDNPAWVLLHLYWLAGVSYSRWDIDSIIAAANYLAVNISYTDQNGATATHPRAAVSLVISQWQSAADVIRRVRLGAGVRVVQDTGNGKLQMFCDSTLAGQQPAPMPGSNYNVAIPSVLPSGGGAVSGYWAYHFDKVININGEPSLKISGPNGGDAPNRVHCEFTNSEREYAADSLTMPDVQAISAGRQVDVNFEALGINSLDQAKRMSRRFLAELNRGNSRNDALGSEFFRFTHSFGAVRVRPGQICGLTDTQSGISLQSIRILQVRPSANFETAEFIAQFHKDDWYRDTYGQEADPENGQNARNRLARPAFPWAPRKEQPQAGDPMYFQSDWSFGLAEDHEEAADGTSIARLVVTGALPVNVFSPIQSPLVARQGTVTSGSVAGGGWIYYSAVCAVDENGKMSQPSILCETAIEVAGTVHGFSMEVLAWPDGTVGWVAYAGQSPNRLTEQMSGTGTPSTITFSQYNERDRGIPDVEADRIRFKVKRVAHSGLFALPVTAVGPSSLTIEGMTWFPDQWVGYDCSIISKNNGVGDLNVLNFAITGNDEETFNTSAATENRVGIGDVLVMRSRPVIGENYLEDQYWQNNIYPAGLTPGAEKGNILRFISGPAAGDVYRIIDNTETRIIIDGTWMRTPTELSRYVIEYPDDVHVQTSQQINNSDPLAELSFNVEVTNYQQSVLGILALCVDGGDNESMEPLSPYRDIYIWGGKGALGQEVIPAHH